MLGVRLMGFGDNKSTLSFTPSHLGTARLPWFTTAKSKSPVRWSQGAQPALASPFVERPDSKWTLKCKGISKKCSFHLRSKILPQSMTTFWALLSILSGPRKKGSQNTGSTTTLITPRVLSAPWFTLYDPQILVVMHTQSSKCWGMKCRVKNARRAHSAMTPEKTHSQIQQETIVPNIQQNASLWKTAPGLQGHGDSFIRPYILHCLLENKLKTYSNTTWAARKK